VAMCLSFPRMRATRWLQHMLVVVHVARTASRTTTSMVVVAVVRRTRMTGPSPFVAACPCAAIFEDTIMAVARLAVWEPLKGHIACVAVKRDAVWSEVALDGCAGAGLGVILELWR
jgi:hypothetical protein